jgi:hypothetical protein
MWRSTTTSRCVRGFAWCSEPITRRPLRYRFHHPTPRLNGQLRGILTDLARADVWLAFDGDVCVGEARLAGYRDRADHADWADLAVTVADDDQHKVSVPIWRGWRCLTTTRSDPVSL